MDCYFCKLRTGSFLCGKNYSQVTLLYKFSLPAFQSEQFFKHTDIPRAPICHGVLTTQTGLCLGKLNFRALFSTDMEASLRNEPIKMKYKIRQRKIKSHLKVENTIFDIFQVFWFC